MSFTLEQLRAAIEDSGEYDGYNGNGSEFYDGFYGKIGKEVPGIGTAFLVEEFGGEGQGDDRWVVFRIEGDDRLFQKDGYYTSYDGATWDYDLVEVEAHEVTVTKYRPVQK
jgi:hypothetical protein